MTQSPQVTPTSSTPAPDFPEARAIVCSQMYGKVEGQVIQFNVTCCCCPSAGASCLRGAGEAWEEKDLWRAGSRQVRHDVYWRESEKLNSQGKPYKNIVQVISGCAKKAGF